MTQAADAEDMTGAEIEHNMSQTARDRAQKELSHLAPGPPEPLHFGDEGQRTQTDEDPISEVNPFQERLP